jgi:hypothetical protein
VGGDPCGVQDTGMLPDFSRAVTFVAPFCPLKSWIVFGATFGGVTALLLSCPLPTLFFGIAVAA